jgi:hypothetical protein
MFTLAATLRVNCSVRAAVTVTVSVSAAGASTTSMFCRALPETDRRCSAKPSARTISTTSPVALTGASNRPSGPLIVRSSMPDGVRMTTDAPTRIVPELSRTVPVIAVPLGACRPRAIRSTAAIAIYRPRATTRPHGLPPTAMRRSTLPDAMSITETSPDGPFEV